MDAKMPFYPAGFISAGIGIIFFQIILLFLLSALLMWLWNITVTRIFNIREITFWEAFRLMIIAAILFGKVFGIGQFNL
ncbi:hypothetical protein OXPF_19360 [Oxobacter pfennigii]|uniref:Uncharacterized protein n=1 Tax=Oxobacter pfennigii TaxID=36849 RepID=A0A0P8WPG7_9CLOT|nr:hypothetical protein [Oxobacter pfennigii]KPU44442.1 hypothetical protein OXPF_19360 [Oxobacter pfennigii]